MKTVRTQGRFELKSVGRAITTFIVAAMLESVCTVTAFAAAPVVPPPKAASVTESAAKKKRVPASLDVADFERSREILKYMQANAGVTKTGKKKKVKSIPESAVIEYFQENPEALKHDLDQVVNELNARPAVVDPTKHVRLVPPAGKPGYEDLHVYVSHPYRLGDGPNDKHMPADNLAQVWIDFIRQAKKEIVLNVFEFDFEQIADELIRAQKNKIAVRVGLDANVLKKNLRDRAVADKMKQAGVTVVEVVPSGLNHQKMVAIDWSDPNLARALFSSGNLTHSCLDAAGDLYAVSKADVMNSKFASSRAIPNANHVVTMKSWLAANLINHELTKTFSTELALRGASYPTSGSYQITGPGVDPQTFEAYPLNSFIITFTPGGAYRAVNRNLLAYLITKSEGPIRMVQFAYSAKDVSQALLERAERDLQATGKFDFLSVGDTPFALQSWSQFLKMSGYKREGSNAKKNLHFSIDPENPWMKSLTPEQMTALRKNVRVAPLVYGKTNVNLNSVNYEVTAKIHHKLMSMGDYAVIGTSFNFSEGAEKNNEQVLIFRDPKLAGIVRGITAELAAASPRSVAEAAELRNARMKSDAAPAVAGEDLDASDVDESAAAAGSGD